jgi:hypothetical protein
MPRGKLFAVIAVVSTVILTAGIATAHGRLAARGSHPAVSSAGVHHFTILHAAKAARLKAAPKADPTSDPSTEPPPPTNAPCVESDDDSTTSGSESDDSSTGNTESDDSGSNGTESDDNNESDNSTGSGGNTPPPTETECDDQNEQNKGTTGSTGSTGSDDDSWNGSGSSGDD